MLRDGEIHKTYWLLSRDIRSARKRNWKNWLFSDGRINKTFIADSGHRDAKSSRGCATVR